MIPDQIRELDELEKEKLGFTSNESIFEYILEKVIEERCDEFDYHLEESGFEIISRDFKRVATSIYNYKVIIHKT